MSESNKNEVQFNVRISNELRECIRVDAFKKDVTLSDVVRQILEAYYGINGQEENRRNHSVRKG